MSMVPYNTEDRGEAKAKVFFARGTPHAQPPADCLSLFFPMVPPHPA